MQSASQQITVIVPTLNESANVPRLVKELVRLDAAQTIIVDGGSHDDTLNQLQSYCDQFTVIGSRQGRALQMNAGAKLAEFDTLLFLHADTCLPSTAHREALRTEYWGRFDVQFDSSSPTMQMIASFMNARSRISGIATGDQAIFVKRKVFESVGGFPAIPLMEDVALSRKLRRLNKPFCSRRRVTTSARRWEKQGIVKTVLRMWWYRLAFALGVPAERLTSDYPNVR